MAFWTLIVILIQSGRMPTHSGKSKTIIWKVQMDVCETKTFESDTRSIIGLMPAKREVEKPQFRSSCC